MRDRSAFEAFARSLEVEREPSGQRFQPDMVEGLPEPARRYLMHAIQPGAPLATSVRLVLNGSIRIARNSDPMAMESEELLAPPRGYVWKARVRKGLIRIRGFDAYEKGSGEMRWWLARVVPIVRASGEGLARSAEGRLLGESIFMPSSLLPLRGARWEAVNESMVRVRVRGQLEEVVLTLEVDPLGRLLRLTFPRWNNDPKNGSVGYLPFVCEEFAAERSFDGYTIPTRFQSGWRLGEEGELPFFFATIENAQFR